MRALIVEGGSVHEIVMSDNPEMYYDEIQEFLHCDFWDLAGWINNIDVALVDQEGRMKADDEQTLHAVTWHMLPLAGNILVLGRGADGDFCSTSMTVEQLKDKILISCNKKGELLGGVWRAQSPAQ